MSNHINTLQKPAFKEPWLWFILTPLIVVIIACSITVSIAVTQRDDAVVDNYYQEGKMINRRFSAEARAKELGLSAELAFDTASNELLLDLRADQAHAIDQETRLRLFFSHPAKAERDGIVELVKHAEMNDGSMRYRADLDMPLEGRHYVRLSALENNGVENNDELWRMSGEINFVQTSRVVLQP